MEINVFIFGHQLTLIFKILKIISVPKISKYVMLKI